MKQFKKHLDVDYIGEQDSLTESEEKALSEFFKKKRLLSAKTKDVSKRNTTKLS